MPFRHATTADIPAYAALRQALWDDYTVAEHASQIEKALRKPSNESLTMLAFSATGACVGFAEAAMRHDYVNGCSSSPVAFLEGIYVAPVERHRGIARGLTEQVVLWAQENGCTELASDAELANTASHAMHKALGFDETERVVFFRKSIA